MSKTPDAAELAARLAELEGIRRVLLLQLELADRVRAEVIRFDDLNRELAERIRRLEAMVRGRS